MPMNRKIYPPDWRQRRLRILARDRYRCTVCGVMDRKQIVRVGDAYVYLDTLKSYDVNTGEYIRTWRQDEPGPEYYGKPITVVITIMHLDQDEWNHDVDDSRLACACQLHHFAYDRFDNERRKRYGKQYRRFQLELF